MRAIEVELNEDLAKYYGGSSRKYVVSGEAVPIKRFRDLIVSTSSLSYLNKDHVLLYRGQERDYRDKGKTVIFPSLYRPDSKKNRITDVQILNAASEILKKEINRRRLMGHLEISKRKHLQWAILQHYEICDTPFLDLTQSLRIACSFAFNGFQDRDRDIDPHVYVFGFPYATNRISYNTEYDLVSMRLLSIMPPDAKRPYFQEGFLAGTEELTPLHEIRAEYDFANILIAKYRLVGGLENWRGQLEAIDYIFLHPQDDEFCDIASKVALELRKKFGDYYSSGALSSAQNQTELRHSDHRDSYALYTLEYMNMVKGHYDLKD